MQIEVFSLFPDAFKSFLEVSIVARALEKHALQVKLTDYRQSSTSKHKKVDDYPYGGFAGMVATPQPLYDALIQSLKPGSAPVIYFTPQGRQLSQKILCHYAEYDRLILLCGHYKEIDQRIRNLAVSDEISIGDYVLSGGELAAQAFIDGIARLLPNVLSDPASAHSDSFYHPKLGFPCYTRPESFMQGKVPEALTCGSHAKIQAWADEQSEILTRVRRPDLLQTKH
ncbi:MAG TPA: tRNA (guanosine(37)-N1)-methyltransferase TrmD [Candidatus Cloacimonadota bacterium]|nr:tRNA (guanosine(37)-N1)-methyltransferase TrmD [Candidatus Cloacimonadota bacterium]